MPKTNTTPNYIKDALKIYELSNDLEIISQDDKKKITDFTLDEVLNEAKYILSCYNEGGHSLNDDLYSEDLETRKETQKQVKQLKKYIEKYSNVFRL